MNKATMENSKSQITAAELDEWFESLDDLLHRHGPDGVRRLMADLQERARSARGGQTGGHRGFPRPRMLRSQVFIHSAP